MARSHILEAPMENRKPGYRRFCDLCSHRKVKKDEHQCELGVMLSEIYRCRLFVPETGFTLDKIFDIMYDCGRYDGILIDGKHLNILNKINKGK